MDTKKFKGNLAFALVSQLVATSVSALSSLIIPKFIGVDQYGYFQLFLFYSTYTGFFHLGLNDGVYLLNGGKTMDSLPKKSLNSQLVVGIIYQSVFGALLLMYGFFGDLNGPRRIVIVQTVVMMLLQNISLYFGYIFQAINETRIFSISLLVSKIFFGVAMFCLLILRVDSFVPYNNAFIASILISLIYCLAHAFPILRCGLEPPRNAIRDSLGSINVGIKLLFANLASMVILGFARWLIDLVWGIETFGQFSLSLQLVTFVSTFLSQVAMVLFPSLRSVDADEQKRLYTSIKRKLDLLLPIVFISYYPILWIASIWLPQYSQGLSILYLLLPLCVFDGKMLICSTTYFKVLRKEKQLLYLNIASAVVAISLGTLSLLFFHSPASVMASAVLAIVFRSLTAEIYIMNYFGTSFGRSSILLFVLSLLFLIMNGLFTQIQAFAATIFLALCFYMLCLSANKHGQHASH